MGFERKVDKGEIPVCPILGVEIAAIDMPTLVAYTEKHLKELSGDYLCVANVHTTVMSFEDESYRAIQNGAVMAIPDGGPLSSVGRKRGFPAMQRTAGPDYLTAILDLSEERGYRHFFYGSTEETLSKLARRLKERYPALQIAGLCSPPFRALTEREQEEERALINAAHADFVWVGLGAPKQERWMYEQRGKIEGFMVGVGAAFDYLAGNLKRAPKWMQRCNLEWLYRLFQDPKHLFKRYFSTNPKFIWHAMIRKK